MPLAYSYFPIESKKLDAQKCPRSNQINAHKECQSKIHQEYSFVVQEHNPSIPL